ncbi:hypothetical protein MMC30_008502 [Trapelia coarctata]|nr:hypothetical protein [Trapelia coarctata]
MFLDAGCNPFKQDLKGHIPSCYAWDSKISWLWQSILGKWVARGGVNEQHTCPCGGLYELDDMREQHHCSCGRLHEWVDMREQYQGSEGESTEGSGLSEREEEQILATEETERCSPGEDLEHNEMIWEDDDGNSEGTGGGSGQSLGSGWGVEGDENLEEQESFEEEAMSSNKIKKWRPWES